MKKNKLLSLSLLLPMFFSIPGCNNTNEEATEVKVYDISLQQDESLLLKTSLVQGKYDFVIEGVGPSLDFTSSEEILWKNELNNVGNISINEGVTELGNYIFFDADIEYVFVPSTLISLGISTFNSETKIYSYSDKITKLTNLYIYSEKEPTKGGRYFYLENGVPKIWDITSILFLGNSFTYYGGTLEQPGVPTMFKKIAESLGKKVIIDFVIKSSYSLSKYADKEDEKGKEVEEKLVNNYYDYAILQEQSTTPINNYTKFATAVKTLNKRIKETQLDCKVILYETWGSPKGIEGTKYSTVSEMEEALRKAYNNAATLINASVHYVGQAFSYVYDNIKDINVYYSDNRHQSDLGAFLSAAIHVRGIFKLDVTKCTNYCGLDTSKCKRLLEVANDIQRI